MRPPLKRTINTSPKSGRRFFNVRSSVRANVRRQYICSKPDCPTRLTREADRFCPAHAHLTMEEVGFVSGEPREEEENHHNEESVNNNNNNHETKPIDDSNSAEASNEATGELHEDQNNGNDNHNDEDDEDEEDDDDDDDDDDDEDDLEEGQLFNDNQDNSSLSNLLDADGNATRASFLSKRLHRNRDIEVNASTGTRSFRDESGRRRFLCSQIPCTKLIKRQGDVFCRRHTTFEGGSSAMDVPPEVTEPQPAPVETKREEIEHFPSFPTANTSLPVPARSRQTSSTTFETPKKQRVGGTHRSFRDGSGRIRFLCSNSECHRRVPRQAVLFCRHHDPQSPTYNSQIPVPPKRIRSTFPKERTVIARMDVNHNTTNEVGELPEKKIRLINQQAYLAAGPAIPIVLSTTPLLDDQWADVLQFFRRFPQVQLSTNLNVNNSTTHLLIDDSKNPLHCTITKKIVQAAVRRHIFIISIHWIKDSLQADRCIAEHTYEIKSDTHTTLRLSHQDPQARYLFDSDELKKVYAFAIECRQCQGSINRNELLELIELAGGKVFDNKLTADILVVLCDATERNLSQIKEKYDRLAIPAIKYVASDFLLKSIIKFEIQDIDKYSL